METIVVDDLDTARAIHEDLQRDAEWIYAAGRFWFCPLTGPAVWQSVTTVAFERRMLEYSRFFLSPPSGPGREPSPKVIGISKAKQLAAIMPAWAEKPDTYFDEGPKGVAFLDDFVHPDGRVSTLHKSHRCRHRLNFPFDPDASCPRFLTFLDEIFEGDSDLDEKKDFLQEYVGACLFGLATSYDKLCVFHGEGANGKSVLLRVIQSLFPSEAVSVIPPQRWGEEYHRAALEGKMLNVCGELPERQLLSSEELKGIIAGDEQDGRHPRGLPFKFKPRAGHIFAANNLPRMNDFSRGLWRRLEVMGFNRNFEGSGVSRDELVDELVAESHGIAMWAAAGAERLTRTRGYTRVPSSEAAKGDWRRDSNPVEMWFYESCREGDTENNYTNSTTLYEHYRRWADRQGYKPLNSTTFGARLTAMGFPWHRKSAGRIRPVVIRMGVDRQLPESYDDPV